MITRAPILLILCWIASVKTVHAQSPQSCFDNKDAACLEAIYADVFSEPSAEKAEAIYLLGLLKLEEEDYESAKKQFMMGMAFGGDRVTLTNHLLDLYDQGTVAFDPADCVTIGSEDCLESLAMSDDSEVSRNAQYLLANILKERDPRQAHSLLKSAVESGHQTAVCELQKLYAAGYEGMPANYDKSVRYGLDCPFSPPFKRFNKEYFAEYEQQTGHRAFAHMENGFSTYSAGMTSPDLAVSLAQLYCDKRKNVRANDTECKVINVDGTFIEDAKASLLPTRFSSATELVSVSAQQAFKEAYTEETSAKVFVHAATGLWSWRSKGSSDKTLEQLKQEALSSCEKHRKTRFEQPCIIVNVNGEWVD